MNEHVEFTVKAEEDLFLTGTENTIRRVTAETNYSCLMLKTQRFSSLFRHYAKYHGLRKDDLEYYFVNPLENEDTPESVHLQRGDTIMVRKRRKPEPPEAAADDNEFIKDMRELLDDEEHMDCVFLVHDGGGSGGEGGGQKSGSATGSPSGVVPIAQTPYSLPTSGAKRSITDTYSDGSSSHVGDASASIVKKEEDDGARLIEIRAHRCVLTARAEYFKALFRKGLTTSASSGIVTSFFRESIDCVVKVEPTFPARIVRYMLEFLYTNRIQAMAASPGSGPLVAGINTDDLLCLLHLSDQWQLRDLKRLCEHELIRSHMSTNTVARMYCATEDFHANRLAKACIEFIMENIREVTGNVAFQEEMRHYPHLCIPILKAAADMIPEPVHKKQRTGDHGGSANTPGANVGGAGISSSPVPDSDA